MRRREARDGHAVGRGADVIEADFFAEMDARRVAAMFAADAELDAVTGRPTTGRGEVDELADPLDVEADEGVGDEDALVDILGQESARVVAADADRRLGQVVGAKADRKSTRLNSSH